LFSTFVIVNNKVVKGGKVMTRFLVIIMITIMGFITGYSCGKSDCEKQDNKPTALDAYRGKITFEITYRDSVAVDSVVVYKVR
jgi:hypothetical protein